jgi:hypothetical protein
LWSVFTVLYEAQIEFKKDFVRVFVEITDAMGIFLICVILTENTLWG